jgi:ribosomal protein S18 acetylase RimI-like enzyme
LENEDISLREATPEDEPFLLEVYASTRMDELEGFGWSDEQKHAFIKMQFLARERCYPPSYNRIILLNGRAVGRILVDRSEASILLRDIAILTEFRNMRIGRRLLQDLMNEGKPIQLHVLSTSPAVRFYERLGFRQTGSDGTYLEMEWS